MAVKLFGHRVSYDTFPEFADILLGRGLWVDVRAFGALGDGTTDDSTAFKNAIAEIEGRDKRGFVLVPYGDYRIDATLSLVKSGVQVIGMGRPRLILGSSVIGFDVIPNEDSDTFLGVSPVTADARLIKLLGLIFKKASGATPTNGIKVESTATKNPAGVIIEDCFIHEMNSHGLYITSAVDTAAPSRVSVRNCQIGNNSGDGIRIDKGGDQIKIERTDIHDNTGDGLYADLISTAINLLLEHCAFVRNAKSEMTWKSVGQSRVLWCAFEQGTTVLTNASKNMIILDGPAASNVGGNLFVGCNINGNSATETTNDVFIDRLDYPIFMACTFTGGSKAIKFSANTLAPILIACNGDQDSLLDTAPKSLQRIADDTGGAAPLYRSEVSDNSFKHEIWGAQSAALKHQFGLDASGNILTRIASGIEWILEIGTDQYLRIDDTVADTETCLLLRRNVGGTLTVQRVSMGATDSGGTGFKVLRVPN